MYDATDLQYKRCMEIIKRLIENKDNITDEALKSMTEQILTTACSIGGSYEEDVITKIVESYIEKNLFK